MERINVGLVGLGWISQVAHLPMLQKLPEANLVAVCDRDPEKTRMVAEKFGLRKFYFDIEEMLEKEEIQAVIVAASTDAHKELAIKAMARGKDVMVEKPVARTYPEALAIAEASREYKRLAMVGMNHRFRPDSMILRSFVEGKELGRIFYVKAGWLRHRTTDSKWILQKEKAGGGVFIDLGIVMLDMTLWMLGYPDVERASASVYHHKTRQVEDTAVVALLLKNDARIHIDVSWSMFLEDDVYYCTIFGSDGSASLNPITVNKELHGNMVNLAPAKIDAPHQMFRRSYENELKHFLGAVRGLHRLISPAEEAVQRMRIVEAVYRAARLGKEVHLKS
jgi:predicted dehydrogenase